VKLAAAISAALALATPVDFLASHQLPDGSFSEKGGISGAALTAWSVLGLLSAGGDTGDALSYLRAHDAEEMPAATQALVAMAEAALGDPRAASELPLGAGQTNTIIWTILARRQAGLAVPKTLTRALVDRQHRSGGWGWATGIAPDSNDTAAAVQALRAASGPRASVARGLAYLRALRKKDGGFPLVSSRDSDAQSTAWVIQAFLAADARVPNGAFAYLTSLRRADGSYRYSKKYAVTPVWVTAQVLPAVRRTPFPLPRG
jgi:hypothetical protein